MDEANATGLTAEQQEQLLKLYRRITCPFMDWVYKVFPIMTRAVHSMISTLRRLGYLPKSPRRTKQRSRLRMRVALKRKGLYHASVWA